MITKLFSIIFTSLIFLISTQYSFPQMVWNQACTFTGTSFSYVSVPHSTTLNITGSFTIEAWINPVHSDSTQTILQKRLAGANGYTLYLSSGKVAIRTNSSTRLIGKTVIPANQWTHIAGSYNSSTNVFRIMINGVQDTTSTVASAIPVTNSDSVYIGGGFNGPFQGKMDEVRIWNSAFTANDVLFNMRTSLGTNSGIYNTLVMSLTFQAANPNGTLFSLTDATGNNNNGFNRGVSTNNLSNVPSNTITLNESLDLDGTGDYAAGPDHANVSPTSGITIEAWVYPRSYNVSTNVFSTIINKGNLSGSVIDYQMNINLRKFNFFVNETQIFALSTSGEFFPLNKWTHLAFTYSGSSGFIQFALNGTLRWDDTNFVGNIHDNSDSLFIGGTSNSQCFDGLIDEVRITSASLSMGTTGNQMFTSINESNDVSSVNVVYNLDGSLVSNTDAGPRLTLRGNSSFSHNAFNNNSPVSPLTNSNVLNFPKAYYMNSTNFRIPNSGTSGFMLSDTLDITANDVITDVNVFVALNHTDEDNLIVSLISPGGTTVTLYSTSSLINNSDNLITIFDDQADSSLASNRFVQYAPKVKPLNNLNSALSGTNSSGRWKLRIQDAATNDTGILIGWGIQFNNQTKRKGILSLTTLIQGFYNPTTNLMVADTMKVFIRNVSSPYAILDSSKALLNDSGKANFVFNNTPEGIPVYLMLKHRNSIETWSRYAGSTFTILFEEFFSPLTSQLSYNFTNSTSSAHGSNQVLVDTGPNKFAIYSGDPNQDGIVDSQDIILIYNDVTNGISGYVVSDITGDGNTDVSDILLAFNNSNAGVEKIIP